MKKFDVTIIGGGPGGYVSAIRAAQNGLNVCLVEKEHLGGICLNWGCIPTKALLKCANVYDTIKKSESFGISAENPQPHIEKMVQHSRETSKKLTGGIEMLMKKNKITVINGVGKIIAKNIVQIEQEKIESKYIVIATGASARKLDGYDIDEDLICTYKGAMIPKSIPENLVIIGGGVIGMEFASFYNSIGSNVTVLELANSILSTEDEQIVAIAKKTFEKNGIKIKTGVSEIKAKREQNGVHLSYIYNNQKEIIQSNKLILSVGVVPNIFNIGIEELKIQLEKNYIKTNEYLQTNIENIFAIGDVTKGPWLAHKASHEGVLVSDFIAYKEKKISKKPHAIVYSNIPSCVYSNPQIASIGMREKDCKDKNIKYKIGTFEAFGNGKAISMHDSTTFVKVIFSDNGELLGAHMVGHEVTEMIQGYGIAKQAELTEEDLMNTIFAHPTISEMMHEAVLDAYKKALHK